MSRIGPLATDIAARAHTRHDVAVCRRW